MHDRRINGKTLSFGHAGILYRNSFVMYDRETESLWVHVTGKAAHGPRKGWQLKQVAASVTTWGDWKRDHPNTLVLPGYRRGGFMGTYVGTETILGMGLSTVVGFKAKLYPFDILADREVVNDEFNGTDLVVAYSKSNGTARAWGRTLDDGRLLEFKKAATKPGGVSEGPFLLQDLTTGSLWSWMTGVAVSGDLAGQQLSTVAHHPILTRRFEGFYPDGPVLQ